VKQEKLANVNLKKTSICQNYLAQPTRTMFLHKNLKNWVIQVQN